MNTQFEPKTMKNYVVGILSLFENDLNLFKVKAENEYEAVKKGMVEFADSTGGKQYEIDWQNSESTLRSWKEQEESRNYFREADMAIGLL